MKQSRRQELRTNELSVYLKQLYESAANYANYLIGGVAVVVIVLVIGLLIRRNQVQALADAWATYSEITNQTEQDDAEILLERARTLAAEHGDDKRMGARILSLQARLAHQVALSLDAPGDKDRRLSLLKEARDTLDRLIRDFGDRKETAERAKLSLAAVEESLAVEGEGDKERIRSIYNDLAGDATCTYATLAQAQLDTLDERLAEFVTVASRPAPPAPKPANTTGSMDLGTPTLDLGTPGEPAALPSITDPADASDPDASEPDASEPDASEPTEEPAAAPAEETSTPAEEPAATAPGA